MLRLQVCRRKKGVVIAGACVVHENCRARRRKHLSSSKTNSKPQNLSAFCFCFTYAFVVFALLFLCLLPPKYPVRRWLGNKGRQKQAMKQKLSRWFSQKVHWLKNALLHVNNLNHHPDLPSLTTTANYQNLQYTTQSTTLQLTWDQKPQLLFCSRWRPLRPSNHFLTRSLSKKPCSSRKHFRITILGMQIEGPIRQVERRRQQTASNLRHYSLPETAIVQLRTINPNETITCGASPSGDLLRNHWPPQAMTQSQGEPPASCHWTICGVRSASVRSNLWM